MGGFAQIPQIQQTVGVADVPPRYARTAPQIPAPEAKGEAQVGEGLGKLADILAVQYQHKQILDADTVSNGVRQGLTQALVDVKQLPGDQQADAFKQKSNDILQAALTDPQNAHIAGYLQSELPKMGAQYADEALRAGASQTMQEHHQQVVFNGKQTANLSGADYKIDAQGNFNDGEIAKAAEQNFVTQVNSMYGKNPNVANEILAGYQQQKLEKRMQSVAENDPMQIGAFIKGLPPGIDPLQLQAAFTHANQSLEKDAHLLDANYAQARGKAMQYQNDFIAKNGHPDMDQLEKDARNLTIRPEDYTHITGMEYQRPTDPATLESYKDRIANVHSQDDINNLKVDIGFAGANRLINGRDVSPLQSLLNQQEVRVKTPAGQADIKARDALKAHYEPVTREDQRLEARYPGIFRRSYERALANYDSDTFGKPTDPAKYTGALDGATKAVPRPGGPPSATKVEPVTPAHEVDDATKAAFKAWLATHPEAAR
jgi:hypothetical protein